jgi:hypothetical protein
MCPRAGLNAVEKGKNSCPCRESDPGCLARSLVPRLTELPRVYETKCSFSFPILIRKALHAATSVTSLFSMNTLF